MNDVFDYSCMQNWLADILKERGITRHNQVLGRSEEELLDSKIFKLGAIRNLSIYFEKKGLFFHGGENSLVRLHFHTKNLWRLRNNGIYNLDDLENCTWRELAYKVGIGCEMADYVEKAMLRMGRKLRG